MQLTMFMHSMSLTKSAELCLVNKDAKRLYVQKQLVLCNLQEVGASGTHSVCVCTIYQNVKLMMFTLQLSDLSTYHHCLAIIVCNPPLPKCYLGECDTCPDVMKLKEKLITNV